MLVDDVHLRRSLTTGDVPAGVDVSRTIQLSAVTRMDIKVKGLAEVKVRVTFKDFLIPFFHFK